MDIHPTLACSLQQRIGLQWELQNFSDITVVVEDTSFQCHKLILGACSEFFQGLFRSQMKENLENRVEIHGITKHIFSVILDFIYKGIDGLTKKNVLDVWSASNQLMIDYLVTHCENFVIKNMTVKNCFYFYRQGLLRSSSSVESYFFDFFHKNFEALRGSPKFLELSVDEVCRIIKSDNLVAKPEDYVADSVVDWLKYNPQTTASSGSEEEVGGREEHATKLLSLVRLSLLSPACFVRLTQCDLRKKVNGMIVEATLENRHHKLPASAIQRLTRQMKHVMVFRKDTTIWVHKLDTGTLHEHSQSPYPKPGSLTVFDNVLYVCTGNTALSMYTHEGSWEEVAHHHSFWHNRMFAKSNILLAHENFIYCLDTFGYCFKRFNCHERKWTLCRSERVFATSLVRFKQFILLLSRKYNIYSTQCFNTNTLEFIQIAPENPLKYSREEDMVIFSDSNDVFILHSDGELWKIISTESSQVDFCLVSKLWDSFWYVYGAIIYEKKLFVFISKLLYGHIDGLLETGCPKDIPGLCEEIKFVDITSDTKCLPMVLSMKA